VIQKIDPLLCHCASLLHQRLTQWMVAADKVLVALVQPLQQPQRGNAIKLSLRTSITRGARQNKVPDAIQIHAESSLLQTVWKEVIHVRVHALTYQLQLSVAVETPPLLVAVESTPAAGNAAPALRSVNGEELTKTRIMLDREQVG
jgi:hypothetical protein